MKQLYKLMLSAMILAVATACERRSLSDDCSGEVSIPVKIDWSISGITPSQENDFDFVHRVSIRFFPEDGSPAFDRYLEGNIFEGKINIPEGIYSVVVYNEAINDVYWSDAVRFDQVDNYKLFSANIIEISPLLYDFYTPQPGETFAAEPLKLASWSLDHFKVTQSNKNCVECNDSINNALTKVKLRRLVIPTHVVAEVTNLKSAVKMEAALTGLASKVYMASGEPSTNPATHLFAFRAPVWSDETQTHGWVERKLLTFGRLLQPTTNSLNLGVTFVSGERYTPDSPLRYDVTDQVTSSQHDGDIEIRVNLALPEVDGDIKINEWDDEEHVIY